MEKRRSTEQPWSGSPASYFTLSWPLSSHYSRHASARHHGRAFHDDQKQAFYFGGVDFSHSRYKTGERAKAACDVGNSDDEPLRGDRLEQGCLDRR